MRYNTVALIPFLFSASLSLRRALVPSVLALLVGGVPLSASASEPQCYQLLPNRSSVVFEAVAANVSANGRIEATDGLLLFNPESVATTRVEIKLSTRTIRFEQGGELLQALIQSAPEVVSFSGKTMERLAHGQFRARGVVRSGDEQATVAIPVSFERSADTLIARSKFDGVLQAAGPLPIQGNAVSSLVFKSVALHRCSPFFTARRSTF